MVKAVIWTRARSVAIPDPWVGAMSHLERVDLPLIRYVFTEGIVSQIGNVTRAHPASTLIFTSPRAVASLFVRDNTPPVLSDSDHIILAGEGCQAAWRTFASGVRPLDRCVCVPARRQSVIDYLSANMLDDHRYLYICSRRAPREMGKYMATLRSTSYNRIESYDTVDTPLLESIPIVERISADYGNSLSCIVAAIMSASTAQAWSRLSSELATRGQPSLQKVRLVSIGPETSKQIVKENMRVSAEAPVPTPDGLAAALRAVADYTGIEPV